MFQKGSRAHDEYLIRRHNKRMEENMKKPRKLFEVFYSEGESLYEIVDENTWIVEIDL